MICAAVPARPVRMSATQNRRYARYIRLAGVLTFRNGHRIIAGYHPVFSRYRGYRVKGLVSAGSMTPAGGWDISNPEPKSGGCVQLAARLKSTVAPENPAPVKPTGPPENSVPWKKTVSPEVPAPVNGGLAPVNVEPKKWTAAPENWAPVKLTVPPENPA